MSLADFEHPVHAYVRASFLTARAASRHMRGGGVIVTLSTPGARLSGVGFLGNAVASAAVEALSRVLAGELGARGIRVVCLRPHAIPGALERGSHTAALFDEATLAALARTTKLGRLPTLEQVAEVAAFVASERAAAMTGAIANLSCGALVD